MKQSFQDRKVEKLTLLVLVLLGSILSVPLEAGVYIVADSGGDFTSIQAALNAAVAGDTILVKEKPDPYFEKITFPASGDSIVGYINLLAFPNEHPIIDGTGVSESNMVLINSRSYIRIKGFEIRNNPGVNDGSGIRVLGSGSYIEICNNIIHDIRGNHAMGITVYGTQSTPISNLIIDNNQIYDCEPAHSEALVLNGNVTDFEVTNNIVSGCDLGIEIGAENNGTIASGIIVRNNLVYKNEKVGIIFGGYASYTGRVKNCKFLNNTCYKNDILYEGWGELAIQYAEDNIIRNNIVYGNEQNVLLYSDNGNINNTLDYNLWFTDAGSNNAKFVWNGNFYGSFVAFQSGSGQGTNSQFNNPQFENPAQADFHISDNSPAINMGDPEFVSRPGEVDIDNEPRVSSERVDIGDDEIQQVSTIFDDKNVHYSNDLSSGYQLHPASPNPFNPTTTLNFDVPRETSGFVNVSLKIYNSLGETVKTLYQGNLSAGSYQIEWNGTTEAENLTPSGIYFAIFKAGDFTQTMKLVLLK